MSEINDSQVSEYFLSNLSFAGFYKACVNDS